MIRTCRNGDCGEFSPLAKAPQQYGVASHSDLPATIRLEVATNGVVVQTYAIAELNLRKPSGKGCDPGESVLLVPSPGGKLEVVDRWNSES